MTALKSPWFWLALLAVVFGAFFLWRRSASAAIRSKSISQTQPPRGGTSDIRAIADIATAASSIFDKVYSSSDDNDDED